MKLKSYKGIEGKTGTIVFIPETEEERLIMGTLRQYFYWGTPDKGTKPQYGGITSHDNYVTSMRFNIPCNCPNFVCRGNHYSEMTYPEYKENETASKYSAEVNKDISIIAQQIYENTKDEGTK